ncbi:RidA family protein [Patulibacter sp.]|uniref:RidA family protein n=1 Tax=Patulibacter sp. TaxID=1912859 RepID=UPI00351E7B88
MSADASGGVRAVRIAVPGPQVFVSGMTARGDDGGVVGIGDAGAQAVQVFANLRSTLEVAGSSLDDVVRLDLYVRDVEDFPAIAAARASAFGDRPLPAATLVEVSRLADPDYLVEVSAIAVTGTLAP